MNYRFALIALVGSMIYLSGAVKYKSGLDYQTGIDANFDSEITYLLSRETVMSEAEKQRYLEASRTQHDSRNLIAEAALKDGESVQNIGIWIIVVGIVGTSISAIFDGIETFNKSQTKKLIASQRRQHSSASQTFPQSTAPAE